MKLRIFKRLGLWYCLTLQTRAGLGFTPSDAYGEWVVRNAAVM